MRRFFLKHSRFWGDLFIMTAVIGSNICSAWAGVGYGVIRSRPPYTTSAPASLWFQILSWTVYPLASVFLILGLCLRCGRERPRDSIQSRVPGGGPAERGSGGGKRFFLKHPWFWGDLLVFIAAAGSNTGSAWAGIQYEILRQAPPGENSAPAGIGFRIIGWTVYPLALALLILGVYLRSRRKRS